jgi:hypothetical protein
VRPNKSIFEVEPSSVRKKMKDKAFARQVNRDDIINGAEQLGVDLDAHIAELIEALRANADALDLRGTAPSEGGQARVRSLCASSGCFASSFASESLLAAFRAMSSAPLSSLLITMTLAAGIAT